MATESFVETAAPPQVADAPNDANYRRRWAILSILGLAQLMVVLDATIVNIALPSAQRALGFDDSGRQWVVTAYALAFGGLLLLGGRLSDLFGRKRMLITGLVGFGVASAIGGSAGSFSVLIAARAGQGAFGALLAPAALSLLTTTFSDPKERSRAFAIYGAIAGAGGGVGLLLGGVLTEYLSWRWCLYVNLAIAAVASAGAVVLIRQAPAAEKRPHLDIPGAVTVIGSLFAIVYGFAHAETAGWADSVTLISLAIGFALMAGFIWWQSRAAHPLLPLRIILDRNRGGSYLAMFIAPVGMFGLFLFLTYYLQLSLGYSPVMTGLAFMPMIGALSGTAVVVSSKVLPRVGPKWIVSGGLLLAAIGLVLLTQVNLTSSYATAILPALILFGAGAGCVFSTAINVATLGVEEDDAGVASALVSTMQQVGGSIGVAVLSTFAASSLTSHLSGKARTAANIADATLHSYTTAFTWAAGALAIGAVAVAALLRRGVVQVDPEAVHLG